MRSQLRTLKKHLAAIFAITAVALAVFGCAAVEERLQQNQNTAANTGAAPAREARESVHLALGNPSAATSDPASRDNFLLVDESSAISYNDSRGTPNWVAWKTVASDLGESLPRPDFRPDPRLPRNFKRIAYYDYSGSGFDRGHLLPSADRFADPEKNEATFFMTNIVPQTGDLNQFPWEKLESYSRTLVRRGYDVYSVAGVYGDAGRIKGKVTVPTNCWKIIAAVLSGTDPADIGDNTVIVAVDMPNIDGIRNDRWQRYRTTVRDIEFKTGYDFFNRLPPELQNVLENRISR